MGVVTDSSTGDDYLVVFGGASPEHGPLGDTYAAKLPKPDEIGGVFCLNLSFDVSSSARILQILRIYTSRGPRYRLQ